MLPAKMVYGDVLVVDEKGSDDDGQVVNDKESEESKKALANDIPMDPFTKDRRAITNTRSFQSVLGVSEIRRTSARRMIAQPHW